MMNLFVRKCSILRHPAQSQFNVGDDVYVRLDCGDPQFIYSVKLYLGHQLIGTDGTAPYEWAKPNSSEHALLRDMEAGSYSLTAKVRYTCGNYRTFSKTFKVGHSRPQAVFVGDQHLTWLNTLKQQHPDWNLSQFKIASQVYIKAMPCNQPTALILWYDQQGKIVGRFSQSARYQGRFQQAKLTKLITDPCRS